jgi:hypothetical protein
LSRRAFDTSLSVSIDQSASWRLFTSGPDTAVDDYRSVAVHISDLI